MLRVSIPHPPPSSAQIFLLGGTVRVPEVLSALFARLKRREMTPNHLASVAQLALLESILRLILLLAQLAPLDIT